MYIMYYYYKKYVLQVDAIYIRLRRFRRAGEKIKSARIRSDRLLSTNLQNFRHQSFFFEISSFLEEHRKNKCGDVG